MVSPKSVRTFDFDIHNKKGALSVIHAKGLFNSVFSLIGLIVGLILLAVTPWEINMPTVLGKSMGLIICLYMILSYHRTITTIKIGNGNIYITLWKKPIVFSLRDVSIIKLSYSGLAGGICTVRIKGEHINKKYYIYAAHEQRERYSLYLELKKYLSEELKLVS